MGLKVKSCANAIPARFEEGKVLCRIGRVEHEILVPSIKTLKFREQCNQYVSQNITLYLADEVYSMVLRCDGTGCIFTPEEKIICKNFLYKPFGYNEFYAASGGVFTFANSVDYRSVELLTDGNSYVLTVCDVPISVTFAKEENPLYLKDINLTLNGLYPKLSLFGDKLFAVDGKGRRTYQIYGSTSVSKVFTIM